MSLFYDFHIGDRVVCTDRFGLPGKCRTGTVAVIKYEGSSIGVRFDEKVDGHTLDGACEKGYGWWFPNSADTYRTPYIVPEAEADAVPPDLSELF